MITYCHLLPRERISGVKLSSPPPFMPLWRPREQLYLLNPAIRKPIIELYWTNFNWTKLSGTYWFFASCFYKDQVLRHQFELLEIEFPLSIASGSFCFCFSVGSFATLMILHIGLPAVFILNHSVTKFVNCSVYFLFLTYLITYLLHGAESFLRR